MPLVVLTPIAACVVVFLLLLLAVRVDNRLSALQHHQAEEFARLRRAITELQRQAPGRPREDTGLPTIGTSERVLQVGDQVEILDGLHEGEYGTVAPPPDWLPEGVVCVELAKGQGARYLEVAKLARLDEAGRG